MFYSHLISLHTQTVTDTRAQPRVTTWAKGHCSIDRQGHGEELLKITNDYVSGFRLYRGYKGYKN